MACCRHKDTPGLLHEESGGQDPSGNLERRLLEAF
jgi:hypothetical protein